MTENTKVSIIIPAFKSDWFDICLNSALNQNYENIEIIICDDSDNDDIKYTTKFYSDKHPGKIIYEKNESRLGESANFYKCVEKSTGNYIKPLYDDDILINSNCIKIMVDYFESTNNICVITTSRINIDDEGNKIIPQAAVFEQLFTNDIIINGKDLLSSFVYSHLNFLGEPSCAMFRKKDFTSIPNGAFNFGNDEIIGIGDLIVYSNLIINTGKDLLLISDPMVGFRSHNNSTSTQLTNNSYIIESQNNFRKKLIKDGHFKTSKSIKATLINGNSFYFDFMDLYRSKFHQEENIFYINEMASMQINNEFIRDDKLISISKLNKIQNRIKERHFHDGIAGLYDIRTLLGKECIANYLEIGSYVGHSASLILEHPYDTNVYCIDPLNLPITHFRGDKDQYSTFCNNLNYYDKDIVLLQGLSTNTDIIKSIAILNLKFDIIFIDGDHNYQTVINDFFNYSPYLNTNGYLVFDDYEDKSHSPDVRLAVNDIVRWIEKNSNSYQILGKIKYKNGNINDSSNLFVIKKCK